MRFLAAAALLLLPLQQEPPKELPVSVRLDWAVPPEMSPKWVTFILEITNHTSGELEVRVEVGSAGSNMLAVRRDRLAPNARKRIMLYLPGQSVSRRVHTAVRDAAGRELFAQDTDYPMDYGRRFTSGGSAVEVLALADRLPGQLPSELYVRLLPEEKVPDRWIGLEDIPVLIIRDFKFDSLLPAQRAAILEWIRRGGTAVLYPGSDRAWLASPFVQELAPVALGASEELTSLPDLEGRYGVFRERTAFAFHRITNGRPLLGDPPMAVEFRRGLGRVVVVPFDLDRAPFDSWPGTAQFRSFLLNRIGRSKQFTFSPESLSGHSPTLHRLATSEVNTLPPFLLLLGLSVLFIISVGPVNYMVVRRLKAPTLLVLTIPAISATFLLIVVVSGYILRGTSTYTFEVCALEAVDGEEEALEAHLFSLFSPTARSFDIVWPEGEIGLPLEQEQSGHDTVRMVFDQTDRWKILGAGFQQWQGRAFVGHATRSLGGSVSFQVVEGSGVNITNGTSYDIRWGLAFDGRELVLFDRIAPGKTGSSGRRILPPEAASTMREGFEERLVFGWVRQCQPRLLYTYPGPNLPEPDPFVLCVLDRLPDEVTLDASRSSSSERACLLHVRKEKR